MVSLRFAVRISFLVIISAIAVLSAPYSFEDREITEDKAGVLNAAKRSLGIAKILQNDADKARQMEENLRRNRARSRTFVIDTIMNSGGANIRRPLRHGGANIRRPLRQGGAGIRRPLRYGGVKPARGNLRQDSSRRRRQGFVHRVLAFVNRLVNRRRRARNTRSRSRFGWSG